jgi:hypothetical protein
VGIKAFACCDKGDSSKLRMNNYYYRFVRGEAKPFSRILLDGEELKFDDRTLKYYLLSREKIEPSLYSGYDIMVPCMKDCEEHSHISVGERNYVRGTEESLFAVVIPIYGQKTSALLCRRTAPSYPWTYRS